jgi:hypothetical protein
MSPATVAFCGCPANIREVTTEGQDARRFAPATARNRKPILAVLRRVLPAWGTVLEIASGTGEHAVYFSTAFPWLGWQPTDCDPEALASIAAWRDAEPRPNLAPPLRLDVTVEPWPLAENGAKPTAMFSANMIHIAPWEACLGLLRGAGTHLGAGAPLVLYGPFRLGGAHTAPSNEAFDADLRRRDPSWGVRDVEAVEEVAAPHGLVLEERVEMPANNQILVFRKRTK